MSIRYRFDQSFLTVLKSKLHSLFQTIISFLHGKWQRYEYFSFRMRPMSHRDGTSDKFLLFATKGKIRKGLGRRRGGGRGKKERKTARTFTVIANQCCLLCPPTRVFREVKPVLELVLLLRLKRARIRRVAATPRHGDPYSRKATRVNDGKHYANNRGRLRR